MSVEIQDLYASLQLQREELERTGWIPGRYQVTKAKEGCGRSWMMAMKTDRAGGLGRGLGIQISRIR